MSKVYVYSCITACILTALLGLLNIITAGISASHNGYLRGAWPQFYNLTILCIVIGALAMVCATGLVLAVIQRYPITTTVFSVLLLVVLIVATVGTIMLLVIRAKLQSTTVHKTTLLFDKYTNSTVNTDASNDVDDIQQGFHCCGVLSPLYWKNKLPPNGTSTPDSCCVESIPNCGKNALTKMNNIELKGCAQFIYLYLRKMHTMLAVQNIILLICCAVGSIMGLFLGSFIHRKYSRV